MDNQNLPDDDATASEMLACSIFGRCKCRLVSFSPTGSAQAMSVIKRDLRVSSEYNRKSIQSRLLVVSPQHI